IECEGATRHQIGASIGVAIARLPHQRDSDDLVRRADRAMYEAKRAGGGKLRFAP
ncbi:MAG: diguanylate cyclase, partial [Betaproteobacteria bacterium]